MKLKIVPLFVAIFLLISGFGSISLSEKSVELVEFDIVKCSQPEIFEYGDYVSIALDEATTYLKNPGQPVLPVVSKTYSFKIGTIISDVVCSFETSEEKIVDKEIIYSGRPQIKSSILGISDFAEKDLNVYSSEEFYPNKWYDYNIGVGLDGNEHITYLTIQFFPVRYSPSKNVIQYVNDFDINIRYEKPVNSLDSNDEYDLLIITPIKFRMSLQRLLKHKNSVGVNTKIVTTNEIYKNVDDGVDEAEKIKYYIKEAVEEFGISYVLLFGGMKGQRLNSWYIPVRYSNLDDASVYETSYVSDLYYADFYKYDKTVGFSFDNWDSNNNGIFAEWNQDNKDVLDLYPDVYIGRLPVRYCFEVKKIVDRIIDYETASCDRCYFDRMAVVAGDSFDDLTWPTPTDYMEGIEETEYALSFMDGFEKTRIYTDGGDIKLTGQNIINELSKGHGFVYFSGHGSPGSWATHPHGDFGTWVGFDNSDIRKLRNKNHLPVLVVGGCHNCQFDVSVFRIFDRTARMWGEAIPKCWGWLFASHKNGGSIATIGNTGLGYGTIGDGPDPPDEIPDSKPDGIPDCIQYLGGWIEPHFFYFYKQDNEKLIGEIHGQTLTHYLQNFTINWDMNWIDHESYSTLVDCKTVQEWVLFGDPSLKISTYN